MKYLYVDIIEYAQKYIFEIELPDFKTGYFCFDQQTNLLIFEEKYKERVGYYDVVTVEDEEGNLTTGFNGLENKGRIIINQRQIKEKFQRSFKVKKLIVSSKIRANFNGVLAIHVPKLPPSKNKKIKISIL